MTLLITICFVPYIDSVNNEFVNYNLLCAYIDSVNNEFVSAEVLYWYHVETVSNGFLGLLRRKNP